MEMAVNEHAFSGDYNMRKGYDFQESFNLSGSIISWIHKYTSFHRRGYTLVELSMGSCALYTNQDAKLVIYYWMEAPL